MATCLLLAILSRWTPKPGIYLDEVFQRALIMSPCFRSLLERVVWTVVLSIDDLDLWLEVIPKSSRRHPNKPAFALNRLRYWLSM